jgi:hypothetical protein
MPKRGTNCLIFRGVTMQFGQDPGSDSPLEYGDDATWPNEPGIVGPPSRGDVEASNDDEDDFDEDDFDDDFDDDFEEEFDDELDEEFDDLDEIPESDDLPAGLPFDDDEEGEEGPAPADPKKTDEEDFEE